MEPSMWLILASMLAVGVALGFIVGRSKNNDAEKIQELESELEKAQEEMGQYRGQVSEHFGKTAELFNKLTHDYREVYEHLAVSSQALCGDQAAKITGDVPDRGLLEAEPHEQPAVDDEQSTEIAPEGLSQEDTGIITEEDKAEEVVGAAVEEQTSEEEVKAKGEAASEAASIEEKAAEARTIH